jgi:hypothetical protein
VDHRTDLWALGVIAYECLTGHLPFRARSLGELVVEITERPTAPASSLRPSLGPAVDHWFGRALAKDREGRFADAREMTDAFAVALSATAEVTRLPSAGPAPRVEPPGPESLPFAPTQAFDTGAGRTRRWLWVAPPVVLGIGGLGLAWSMTKESAPAPTTGDTREAARANGSEGSAVPAPEDAARAAFGDPKAIVQIAANSQTSCVRFDTGRVACWGTNARFDALGAAPTAVARDVLSGLAVDHLEAAAATICALAKGDGVRCFQASPEVEAFAASRSFDRFVLASAGACGIASGVLECVRPDASGALQRTTLSKSAAEVTLGNEFGCWLDHDGKGSCWRVPSGVNSQETVTRGLIPRRVLALDGATGLRGGAQHACAIRKDRKVVCVGASTLGALGTADRRKSIDMSSLQSVQDEGRIHESVVPNLEDVVELVAGARFTCAVTKARSLFCWGANGFGQLGLGRTSSAEPTPALTLENVRVVGAGAEHACAVTTDGRVLCWGKASEAQLARAPTERCGSGDCQPTPSPATPW